MCLSKEVNGDELALLPSRPDGAWCLLAQRWADRSNLRWVSPSSLKGGVWSAFHLRVTTLRCPWRNTDASDDNCEISVQKIQLHTSLKCACFWRHNEGTEEHTGEGAGVKPDLLWQPFPSRKGWCWHPMLMLVSELWCSCLLCDIWRAALLTKAK